jgi:hypothetical protein
MRIKKLLSLVLCVVMVLSINAVAFASSSPTEPLIDPNDTENRVRSSTTVDSFSGAKEATEEDIQKWADVEKSAATKILLYLWQHGQPFPLSIIMGKQTYYSCGPASVRMGQG